MEILIYPVCTKSKSASDTVEAAHYVQDKRLLTTFWVDL